MDKSTLFLLICCAALVSGCGGSGGNATPPPPPGPVATPPPAPDPDPTTAAGWIERYADKDNNDCRAKTPGFSALQGWIIDKKRELGDSRVWIWDGGEHGEDVEETFNDCAVKGWDQMADMLASPRPAKFVDIHAEEEHEYNPLAKIEREYDVAQRKELRLLISRSGNTLDSPGVNPVDWGGHLNSNGGETPNIMLVLAMGNRPSTLDMPLPQTLTQPSTEYQYSPGLIEAVKPENVEQARWILVGGYDGGPDNPALPEPRVYPGDSDEELGSSTCGKAAPLCLFAPFEGAGGYLTSHATPQVSAALDAVWAVWPKLTALDLRNLAFDCAKYQGSDPTGNLPLSFSAAVHSHFSEGEKTSDYNSIWGHGILSLECLFTENGALMDEETGEVISGGIYGPLAGPAASASITGFDYTGRDFGYGFARPVARENLALAAIANLRPVEAISSLHAQRYGSGSVYGSLWERGALRVDLTASAAYRGVGGAAIGVAAHWQVGNIAIRGGIATQPEGVGSLAGSRAFRAPSTVSAAMTAAYAKALPYGFSVHVQADHWRTVATRGRSRWESAELAESRLGASLVKRVRRHEVALQASWQSGLTGSVNAGGRSWAVAGVREAGVWLTWGYAQ